ncbi:MAG TPA: hypothetical protein ENI82_04855 [Bacteroidetes bacterium]|nr:hypothetical protein [Bacteroidota bacterium]
MEFGEYFELKVVYLIALFEIGAYHKYLSKVEELIAATILHNIKYHKGEDIYQKLLFKKAAAYYHLSQLEKAEHILRELINMNPYDEVVILLLKKCLQKKQPAYVRHTRALSILAFLLSAVIISVEVLLIRNFFQDYTDSFELCRNIVFIVGLLFLLSGDLFHYVQVNTKVNKFVNAARHRRS